MSALNFVVPIRTVGNNELYRHVGKRVYKTKKARDFCETIAHYGMQAKARAGWPTYEGPVDVLVVYYFASESPDSDSPNKQVFDALQVSRNVILRNGRVRSRVGAAIIVDDDQIRDHHIRWRVDPAHPRICIAVAPTGHLFELRMLVECSEYGWNPIPGASNARFP